MFPNYTSNLVVMGIDFHGGWWNDFKGFFLWVIRDIFLCFDLLDLRGIGWKMNGIAVFLQNGFVGFEVLVLKFADGIYISLSFSSFLSILSRFVAWFTLFQSLHHSLIFSLFLIVFKILSPIIFHHFVGLFPRDFMDCPPR